jgi:hypothetical protein
MIWNGVVAVAWCIYNSTHQYVFDHAFLEKKCFIWSFLKFCVDPSHEGCWLFCNSLYVNSLTPESIWYVNKEMYYMDS